MSRIFNKFCHTYYEVQLYKKECVSFGKYLAMTLYTKEIQTLIQPNNVTNSKGISVLLT